MRNPATGWGGLKAVCALALTLAACAGPQRPERVILDATATTGRAVYTSARSDTDATWNGNFEQTHQRQGAGARLRYVSGNGGGLGAALHAVHGRRSLVRRYSPTGVTGFEGGPNYQQYIASLSAFGRGETVHTDFGVHAVIPSGGESQFIPWLSLRPADGAGIGPTAVLGPEDVVLSVNIIAAGVSATAGPIDLRALLSFNGHLVNEQDVRDALGVSRMGWGGWFDMRYDAEPFGVVVSALAAAEPALRLGLTWNWVLDPAPRPQGNVGDR